MQPLKRVKPGETVTAAKVNEAIDRINWHANLSVGVGLELRHGAGARCLSATRRPVRTVKPKYDVWKVSLGTLEVVWSYSVNGHAPPSCSKEEPLHVCIDYESNVYVGTIATGTGGAHNEARIHKILADGTPAWIATLPFPDTGVNRAQYFQIDVIESPDNLGVFAATNYPWSTSDSAWDKDIVHKLDLSDGHLLSSAHPLAYYGFPASNTIHSIEEAVRLEYTPSSPANMHVTWGESYAPGVGNSHGAEFSLAGNYLYVTGALKGITSACRRPYSLFGMSEVYYNNKFNVFNWGFPQQRWDTNAMPTAVSRDGNPLIAYIATLQQPESLWKVNWLLTAPPPYPIAEWGKKIPFECSGYICELLNMSTADPAADALCLGIYSGDTSKEDGLIWWVRPETGDVFQKCRPQRLFGKTAAIYDVVADNDFIYCCGTEG